MKNQWSSIAEWLVISSAISSLLPLIGDKWSKPPFQVSGTFKSRFPFSFVIIPVIQRFHSKADNIRKGLDLSLLFVVSLSLSD
jgi:hypothetical protein